MADIISCHGGLSAYITNSCHISYSFCCFLKRRFIPFLPRPDKIFYGYPVFDISFGRIGGTGGLRTKLWYSSIHQLFSIPSQKNIDIFPSMEYVTSLKCNFTFGLLSPYRRANLLYKRRGHLQSHRRRTGTHYRLMPFLLSFRNSRLFRFISVLVKNLAYRCVFSCRDSTFQPMNLQSKQPE